MSDTLANETKAGGWRPWLVVLILILILLAAFVLRSWHLDWADGQLPHPDERSTVAFYAPSIHWPQEGISPLDKRQSPLNPLWDVTRQERRSYTYGHFPLYLLVLTANGINKLAPVAEKLGASADLVDTLRKANGVPGFALVGRAIMAIADTLTVLLIFLLATHTYRRRAWVGLLAAAFSAFTVLQIQLSHFFAVDPISTTFTVLTLYGALRMVDRQSWGWSLVTGIGAGLAIASKFSALPILAAPVVAGFLIWWRQRNDERGMQNDEFRNHSSSLIIQKSLLLVLLALLVALVTFAVTSPFAILDWENFKQAVLVEQGAMVRGQADFPFTRQYRGTQPYLYHIQQQVRWGIGWPLGLLAFVGLAWSILKLLGGRARDGEIIILSWIVPYFGLTGLFLAKFMRYMVPVVPLLMVFAAGLVAAIWYGEVWEKRDRVQSSEFGIQNSELRTHRSKSTRRHVLAAAVAAIALLGAVFWSLAYVNGVYNDTHPWIKASRWMYANIPDGSTMAWEQWDDSLPYDLPEPNSSRGRYRFVDWGPFEEDTADKFERMKSTLRQADYIALSSNRIYGAVDNLPERYPMTNRYYQMLFDGQLGYELALKEVNHPHLLGFDINDEQADESFTLYDHPTVLVFRKVRDLSDDEWNRLLGGSWEGAKPWDVGKPILLQRIWPAEGKEQPAAQEPGPGEGKSLLLDKPVDQLPVLDDFRWNSLASRSTALAVLVWWLAISLLGLVAWPIAFALFSSFRDRGYLFARSLGWLIVGYLVWIAASVRIANYSLWAIALALLLMLAFSLALWRRNRATMAAFWRTHKGFVLFCEALFAGAYLLFVALRIANPDLWQPWNGGEKFMEFAFLNAILRSANFPPLDPYFAGGTINYYYYGHYLVSLLVKLSGIWSSVAFNLAVPTVFALTVANVFSLAYNLAGRIDLGPGLSAMPRTKGRTSTDGSVQAPAVDGELLSSDPVPGVEPGGELDATAAQVVDRAAPAPEEGERGWLRPRWLWHGVGAGLLAAFFVALLGNVDGGGQAMRSLASLSTSSFESRLPGLQTAVRAADGLVKVLGPAALPPYHYWDPSRVIPNTINEFPYWSFLFADLHPHMIGISFTVLFIALAFNLLASARHPLRLTAIRHPLSILGQLLAMALVLGALAVINTWDLPTYFGLAVLVWLVGEWRSGRLAEAPVKSLLRTIAFAGGLLALALLLYWPFFAHYEPLASSGVGLLKEKTQLGQWLNIWGFLGFVAVTFVLVELRRRPTRLRVLAAESGTSEAGGHGLEEGATTTTSVQDGDAADGLELQSQSQGDPNVLVVAEKQPATTLVRDPAFLRWLRLGLDRLAGLPRLVELAPALSNGALLTVGLAVLAAVLLWIAGWRVPAVLLLPLLGAAALLFRRTAAVESQFLGVLVFTGFLVLLGVEFFYLKDHLQGGDWRRMNTLFKFYIQVWVMLAIASAVALPSIWRFIGRHWRMGWRVAWTIAFAWLLGLSLVFLVAGTSARLNDRFPPENGRPPVGTLDGMAYMIPGSYTWHPDPAQAPNTRIELRYDYEALRWLLDNVKGTPVVAEALVGYYREGGLRVATFTGFPTLLGFHEEGEQRYGWQTGQRRNLAEEFWTTTDPQRAQQLIEELDIDYVYVGQLEHIMYPPQALAKFDQLVEMGRLEKVYSNDKVMIYHVKR